MNKLEIAIEKYENDLSNLRIIRQKLIKLNLGYKEIETMDVAIHLMICKISKLEEIYETYFSEE